MRHTRTLVAAILMSTAVATAEVELNGVGATLPYPLYQEWFDVYERLEGTTVRYYPAGSGAGIEAVLERRADFGASDAFLDDRALAAAPGEVIHIPTCLGAVVVTYNLPGIPELRFTPELLSGIFRGEITSWTDRRIAEVNPGLRFPDLAVTVVHRADASGTTMVFTDFLSQTTVGWKETVGAATTVAWPVGVEADGNDGVAQLVEQTPGAIGYVEHGYARNRDLPTAAVKNASAYFVKPTMESLTAAARVPLPADARRMVTNTDAPDGYPLTALTYLLVYREQAYDGRSRERAAALAELLWWAIHDGQALNEELLYAPLPGNAVLKAEKLLRSLTYDGARLLAK